MRARLVLVRGVEMWNGGFGYSLAPSGHHCYGVQYYFDHEKLQVYQMARELNRRVLHVLSLVPRGHADSRDNLRRAAMSVSRNIAEGAGRWSVPDKMHFYQIARASATECAASLDELVDCAGLKERDVQEGKRTAARIVAMLVSMIRSLESRT